MAVLHQRFDDPAARFSRGNGSPFNISAVGSTLQKMKLVGIVLLASGLAWSAVNWAGNKPSQSGDSLANLLNTILRQRRLIQGMVMALLGAMLVLAALETPMTQEQHPPIVEQLDSTARAQYLLGGVLLVLLMMAGIGECLGIGKSPAGSKDKSF